MRTAANSEVRPSPRDGRGKGHQTYLAPADCLRQLAPLLRAGISAKAVTPALRLLSPIRQNNRDEKRKEERAHLKKGRVKVLELLLRGAQGSVDTLELHPQLSLGVAQRLVQAPDRIQLSLELVCEMPRVPTQKRETWHEVVGWHNQPRKAMV